MTMVGWKEILVISFLSKINSSTLHIFTLECLITVQHLLNVHNGKLDFIWLAKKDDLILLN